jgi:sodium transport system permease protein
MRIRTVSTIFRKELLDTRRDKRTLFMMVVLPVLLYPATLLIGAQALMVHQQSIESSPVRVCLAAVERGDTEVMKSWVADVKNIQIIDSRNPQADLGRGKLDVVVVARSGLLGTFDAGYTLPIDLLYDKTEFRSAEAAGRIEDALSEVYHQEQVRRLENATINAEYINPLEVKRVDVAPKEKTSGTLIGLIMPMLMVIVMALGAFYPAVDLTAGEKERGTFETLLSTPATKMEIVTGKFLTVFIMAMLTAVLNLVSMGATFHVFFAQISSLNGANLTLMLQNPARLAAMVLLIIVPLALLLSALMMSVAVFAKSFREAQNYLTPVLMLVLLPAMLAGSPGIEFSASVQFIPIVNTVLLFKDAMIGKAAWEGVFAVFVSTAAYALLALVFAARVFQREDVILSEEPGMPLSFRRRDYAPRPSPSPGFALTLFALVMLLIFYVGALAQRQSPLWGLALTEWGLILLPVVGSLWYARVNLRGTLRLRAFSPVQGAGAVCLALSMLTLIIGFSAVNEQFLPVPDSMKEEFGRFLTGTDSWTGLSMLLLVAALSPAICEEALFRGALLSGLRQGMRPLFAVLSVSVLFGLFHLSIYRFAPTALLGLAITYAVWRTNSLWIGVIIHFINNCLALLLGTGKLPTVIAELVVTANGEPKKLSTGVIAVAFAGLLLGVALIEAAGRAAKRKTASSAS